ncbi:hypothetical protein ETAE_2549 [Edwardsiella piscicida]|uniref:Uncharacterized protein n=2 Tax=Edwardsiella TaxID=635 RepID=A0A0H3DV90_EDWTF|nr:hypothetical protein ETAE_2549 [Edwardsiella tarda EIB202]ADM42393.1 hypothetical protein ETAF_2290 [Edwardsiella tarda FL6-60]
MFFELRLEKSLNNAAAPARKKIFAPAAVPLPGGVRQLIHYSCG